MKRKIYSFIIVLLFFKGTLSYAPKNPGECSADSTPSVVCKGTENKVVPPRTVTPPCSVTAKALKTFNTVCIPKLERSSNQTSARIDVSTNQSESKSKKQSKVLAIVPYQAQQTCQAYSRSLQLYKLTSWSKRVFHPRESCSTKVPIRMVSGAEGTVYIFKQIAVKRFHKIESYRSEIVKTLYVQKMAINKVHVLAHNPTAGTIHYEKFKSDLTPYTIGKPIISGCGQSQKIDSSRINSSSIRKLKEDLETLHSKLIIHNDIHPGNIALKFDGSLSLADYGLTLALKDEQIAKIIELLPISRRGKLKLSINKFLSANGIPDIHNLLKKELLRMSRKGPADEELIKLVELINTMDAAHKCDIIQFRVMFPDSDIRETFPLNLAQKLYQML